MGVRGWSPRTPVFASPVPAHLADAGLIRPSPGGWERNMFLSKAFRGLQPRTPGDFSLAGKVTKKPHKGGTLSMGSLPYVSLPRDDQRGGCGPLFGFSPQQSMRGASTVEQKDRRLCGGFQRGACAPLCVVVGEGYIREGPHRKGPSLMRLFGHFFGVEKVTRGTGAEPPISSESQKFREEGKTPPPAPGEIKDQMYPSAHSSSARSTAPPAAPRRVLWLRQTNL